MSARLTLFVPMLVALAGVSSGAMAQAAKPDDRCSGTLCDLYYGMGGTAPQAPAAGTTAAASPATTVPAAVPVPHVAVQGGGVVGLLSGAPQERCTGTLCDFFYGGPPPEKVPAALTPAEAPRALAPGEAPRNALAPAEAPETDDAPVRRRSRRDEADAAPPEEKPHCVAPAADPWRCYR